MAYDLDISDIEGFTGSEGAGDPVTTTQAAPAETTQPQRFKYTANGKEVEEDLDTILQRASMGYNYAQHMQSFKSEKDAFAQERDSINQLRQQWEPYDKYARENPEWADHVRQAWEQKVSGIEQKAADGTALPEELRQEMSDLKQFKAKFEHFMTKQQEAEEDAVINKQFDELAKEYPEYDLKHSDPKTGMTLEMQVLEHARLNGIHSVRAAFRDLMWNDLVAKAQTKAKEQTAKEIAERTKKGFLAESNAPIVHKPLTKAGRGGSYLDGIMSGAQELGII
jgi:hypothetical protein